MCIIKYKFIIINIYGYILWVYLCYVDESYIVGGIKFCEKKKIDVYFLLLKGKLFVFYLEEICFI